MNEQIFELAVQAKLRCPLLLQYWGKIDALTDSEQEELESIEKFAELIVKSIITNMESAQDIYANPDRYMDSQWYVEMRAKHDAIKDAIDGIKHYFGDKS